MAARTSPWGGWVPSSSSSSTRPAAAELQLQETVAPPLPTPHQEEQYPQNGGWAPSPPPRNKTLAIPDHTWPSIEGEGVPGYSKVKILADADESRRINNTGDDIDILSKLVELLLLGECSEEMVAKLVGLLEVIKNLIQRKTVAGAKPGTSDSASGSIDWDSDGDQTSMNTSRTENRSDPCPVPMEEELPEKQAKLGSAEVQQLVQSLSNTDNVGDSEKRGRKPNKDNSNGIHECPECGKSFLCRNSLWQHLYLHKDKRPFQCSKCDANYKSCSELNRHQRIHTGEKPAKCEHCGRRFRTYSTLRVHKRTHTGEKPFECRHCGKCFSTRGYRNIHERIHTGEKPHKCEFCSMRFTDISGLRGHRFTHTGEYPFKCNECDQGFSQTRKLKNHLKNAHSAKCN